MTGKLNTNVERAAKISGWMSLEELGWLAEQAVTRNIVVEFGAWQGRSSTVLATAKQLLCIDTWAGSAEHQQIIAGGLDIWLEWQHNMKDYPNVTAHRIDLADKNAVNSLCATIESEGGADMVFIDASHDYESVRRDISIAMKMLKPEGLLCGHDYSRHWPGVVKAVDELIPNRELCGAIWRLI